MERAVKVCTATKSARWLGRDQSLLLDCHLVVMPPNAGAQAFPWGFPALAQQDRAGTSGDRQGPPLPGNPAQAALKHDHTLQEYASPTRLGAARYLLLARPSWHDLSKLQFQDSQCRIYAHRSAESSEVSNA